MGSSHSRKPSGSRYISNKGKSKTSGGESSNGPVYRLVLTYTATGGGLVTIYEPINPWKVLGIQSTGASRQAVKTAFKTKINQSKRQNRAMVSLANHILTSTSARYSRKDGTDEFFVTKRDNFMLAACGQTEEIESRITMHGLNVLKDADEHGRTLLHIASKSGFYDTCKLLLEKGASVNDVQRDDSTPLHGAAFYGHALVVGLLLVHGARCDLRNKFGNTAFDESATPEIRNLIQTASVDRIAYLAIRLREKQLVHRVRLIEHGGKVIGKELFRDPRTLDTDTQAQWNHIQSTWKLVWHGTRYRSLEPIMERGLIPAGSSGIKPSKGHYGLNEVHFGIVNWAAAIFLSPSVLYAAHAVYSDRVVSESEQWCVLVKAYCKPGSYKSYDPTILKYEPMDGEPDMPEYRIPVTEANKNVILRLECMRSVVVRSVIFVRLSFLESQDTNFEKAMKLLE